MVLTLEVAGTQKRGQPGRQWKDTVENDTSVIGLEKVIASKERHGGDKSMDWSTSAIAGDGQNTNAVPSGPKVHMNSPYDLKSNYFGLKN